LNAGLQVDIAKFTRA
jgi:hypothetical protein